MPRSVALAPPRWAGSAGLALLLAAAFACYLTPVADIDVWWHLASGRWIVEHGALPDVDPFGVFGAGNAVRTATVLKGQWLGQVTLHGAMRAGGPLGVAVVRAAALAAAAALVYARTRRLGGGPGTSLVAAGMVATALLGFPGERPQALAFVLAGVVLLLVEEWERGRAWALAGVAAAGITWVNVHGSILIAVAVLAVAAAVEGIRGWAGAQGTGARRTAVAAAVLGVATVVSPNGVTTYRYVLQTQGGVLASRTSEYVSALRVHAVGGWAPQVLVLAFLVFAGVALVLLARAAPGRAAATGLLVVASATSYRYHAFLVVLATPWLSVALWPDSGAGVRRWSRLLAGAAAVALGAIVVWAGGGPLRALRAPVEPGLFPVEAVERLRASTARGRALVGFSWSGHVLWAAWPKITPVVDPRMLEDAMLAPYTHMIWATPEGLAALDAARITAVLLPFRSPTGDVYALHGVLRGRPEWVVDHVWPGGALYLRVR